MPRVPAARQTVLTEPLPSPNPVRVDVSSGTEAIASGLGQVSQVATRIAEEKIQEQRRAQLQDAWTELGSVRADIQSTARQQRGKDALQTDLAAQSEQLLNNAADTIQEKLPPALHDDFARIRRQHAIGLLDAVNEHVDKESQAYALHQYQGSLDLARNLGIDGAASASSGLAADAPQVLEARQSILNAVGTQTRTASPEAAAAERTLQLSHLHLAVLDRLTDQGRGQDAQAYLARFGPEIDGTLRGKSNIDKIVKAAGIKDQGRAEADRIWVQSEGDPAKALELARGIPQTELADEVDRRLKEHIGADHAARVAADAPREGRLEQGIYQRFSLDRSSADYQKLSDEGKARVEAKFLAALRSNRAEASDERRRQADLDRQAEFNFRGLPLANAPGQDMTSIDVDHSPLFQDASPTKRLQIKNVFQKQAQAEWQRDQGVSIDNFKAKVNQVADGLGYVGKSTQKVIARKTFVDFMLAERSRWMNENPGTKVGPPPEAVSKMFSEALRWGDQGGLHWSSNEYAYQATTAGHEFSTEGFESDQPGAALLQRLGIAPNAPPAAPLAPRAPSAPRTAPVRISSDAEYEALPSGTPFLGPDGKLRRKP